MGQTRTFLQHLKQERYAKHIIPFLLIMAGIILTAFGVHGWSVGELKSYYDDNTSADSSLIYGHPQPIRSDEWLVLTPKSIAQYESGNRTINGHIGTGEDEALIVDAPTKDFSQLFAPQNAGFFFLPLGNALAFKWWFLLVGLLVSAYYFSLRFFTSNKWVAISLAAFVAYAPLVQWTFRSFLVLPIMFGLLSIIAADALRKQKQRMKQLLYGLLLIYVLFGFIIVIYPPFQIISALMLAAFYIGVVCNETKSIKKIFFDHIPHAIVLVAVILLMCIFYVGHKPGIEAFRNADFPGYRSFTSGKIDREARLADLWTAGTSKILFTSGPTYLRKANYNPSEAAAAVWLWLPLMTSLSIVWFARRKNRKPTATIIVGLLLLSFILMWYFIPGLSLPLLNQIPINRLSLGLLLAEFLSLGLLVRYQKDLYTAVNRNKLLRYSLYGSWAIHIGIMITALAGIHHYYPDAMTVKMFMIASVAMISIAVLFVVRRMNIALGVLALLSVYVSGTVNPFYRGVDSVMNAALVQKIDTINSQNAGGWFFDGSFFFTALPLLTNVQTLTTNYSYKQDFWEDIDPTGKAEHIYNRSGYVLGDVSNYTGVNLIGNTKIILHIDPCNEHLMQKLHIRYIVTTKNPGLSNYVSPCMKHIGTVTTPKLGEVRLYRIVENEKT